MQTGKYIIVSREKSTGNCSMSVTPKEHSSEANAKQEAARLATENYEKEFTVVKVVATASVAKVTWR